jgi:AcrR family transcriptional regulator
MYESKDTKTNLLAAALRLFAERGYENTSIRAITSLSGANLGAVTYHFQSKENLYQEVLKSKAEPLYLLLAAIAEDPGDPAERIERIARGFFEHLLTNPEMPALLLHEISLRRPVPGPIRETMSRLFGLLNSLIRQGQQQGSIIKGDPALLAISTITQPAYAAVMRQVMQDVAGYDLENPATRREVLDHFMLFLRRGLAPAGNQE